MKEFYSMKKKEREEIKRSAEEVLLREEGIVFAYCFGSFLNDPSFRDIDVGIYAENIKKEDVFSYELELAEKLASATGCAFDVFDVKVLNFAPYSFLNNIFRKGYLIFSHQPELLSDLIEKTSIFVSANEGVSEQSMKEIISY